MPAERVKPAIRRRPRAQAGLLAPALCVLVSLAPAPAAGELEPLAIGVRARVGEKRVLGKEQPESFREYDVFASFRLPWERYSAAGWGTGTRLLAGLGLLRGADKNALVVSGIPVLAFGSQDGRYAVDMGAGLALVSEHRFAQQDFGGPLQFALTLGVGVPLYQRLGVGYRFLHYSDAGMYGPHTIGADFHMVEFMHRF